MSITDHQSVPARTHEILGLIVGASTNVTGEGVFCELNLLYWVLIPTGFQVIDRTQLADPSVNLLNIFLLYSRYFLLSLTQDFTRMA